ncbi:DUF3617 domain-containing protein [Sphingomonas morindae]|uniref:DUF3617 domain-containing protein n=1 Tax=Sphingomonas morindae TaxID=1541170 RepID=A0ABY4XAV5_9SPHN|nr:DUF3617 family protein [Sphingomonas morindae]USI74102.1 DUF3617 domain-containing protein [Sphingomonas morindae]
MIRPLRIALALPLLLAAAPAPPLMPGLWEETLVFALDSVNGSSEMAAQMQKVLPTPRPRRDCYSAAELADPRAILLGSVGQACRFTRFDMAGGRIVASGDCTDARGQALHVDGSGTYTATGYDFTFTGTGRNDHFDMGFRGRDSGRRLAACPAG